MQPKDFHDSIRRLRKQATGFLLELDALEQTVPTSTPEPAPAKGRNKYRQQIAVNEATGSWRKPIQLKKKSKKPA